MNPEQLAERMDGQIEEMFRDTSGEQGRSDALLRIASELRLLPSQEFRESLKGELMEQAEALQVSLQIVPSSVPLQNPEILPTFSRREFAALPADPRSLFFSFLSHVAVVALIASGIWAGQKTIAKNPVLSSEVNYLPLPPGTEVPHGGGGGGDHSAVQASRGTPPKFADEQLAPPMVVHSEVPKLPAPPTVLGPPDLKLPQSNQIGDLVSSNVVIPSNGTGSRSGVGDNAGTGIGPGKGPGVGPGFNGGIGGDTFRVGNGVSAPRAIYSPDPEYSDEARRAKFQGYVVLALVVDPTGHVRDIHVARSLGMGLDEKALEAVRSWKFTPGMKDGRPVAVQVNVEVNFRLY